MPQIEVRESTALDLAYLASNMRAMCSEEALAVSDSLIPEKILKSSFESSKEAISILCDGNCVCMMGYVENGNKALVWMITANDIVALPLTLVKTIKKKLKYLSDKYTEVFSFVQADIDDKHKGWMKWLGFKFEDETIPVGEKNNLFRKVIYTGGM